MSDTHTTERPAARTRSQTLVEDRFDDRFEDLGQDGMGHGRHRGALRADDVETAPSGRHRKQSGQAQAGSAG